MRSRDHRSENPSNASEMGRNGRRFLGPFPFEQGRHFIALNLLILAAFLFACQSPPPAGDSSLTTAVSESTGSSRSWPATPPFFEVDAGRGAKLYLLGTIHVGPAAGWSFPPDVDHKIREASAIVLEVDLRSATEESISQAVMQYGILPADTPLSKIISPATAQLLEIHDDLLISSGLPGPVREAMKPWLIMSVLVESALAQADYLAAQSVEEKLMSTLDERELIALETVDEQLAILGGLPLDVQELILQDTLLRSDSVAIELENLIRAWREDDRVDLLRISREGIEEFPELDSFYDVILDDRNRNWKTQLVELLEDPDRAGMSILVAVGALHLIGPTSVPSLLRDSGYRVSDSDTPPAPPTQPH